MTDNMDEYNAVINRLEQDIDVPNLTHDDIDCLYLFSMVSQAISLKRIADALERLGEQKAVANEVYKNKS